LKVLLSAQQDPEKRGAERQCEEVLQMAQEIPEAGENEPRKSAGGSLTISEPLA